ncbi:unnamed protein product [Didymodactylos carnosus]|uniref:Carbonic anhydrase n=1 Tax=Didymodactylos carnosus TaxID=1234261 RepID=A0A815CJ14_9BILA|nr:unnamed protein product [Didymodactylos carnosus]CAF1285812.1 unnamed protein product [Didymodactylos carnosus]CAF3960092.1 unnamed protein product [Didymodactylos carnosus]CAF4086094.1 unnamed protein product [Didymodactylos carnosus]
MSCADESNDYWNYNDPSKWHEHFPSAGGFSQSPINIKSNETVPQVYPAFSFSPNYTHQLLFTLTNNGHQVAVTQAAKSTSSQNQPDLWFTGGGLHGKFHFVNFHLHWGKNDRHGSEHEIDGYRFPAEAHFVHKNLETKETAVFAFFFDIASKHHHENVEWKKYADAASQLKNTGDTVDCTFHLSNLMQIEDRQYFRYTGSLTTPPCAEGVIWTIFFTVIPIAEKSLNELRQNVMRKVYRPVQPVNGRVIYRNYGH